MTFTPDILYEDYDMVIINKPAGLPVHSGPKGGDNIEDLVQALYKDAKRPPHLAHRLDRDTSGCLIFGKTKQSLRRLNHLFASKKITKSYLAISKGIPPQSTMNIDVPLAKINDDPRSWWMEVNKEKGQHALTQITILNHNDEYALVECQPKTGRTHQIRVHLAHIGTPILGDTIYGDKGDDRGLMLHAYRLTIPYKPDKEISVIAPLSNALKKQLETLNLSMKQIG